MFVANLSQRHLEAEAPGDDSGCFSATPGEEMRVGLAWFKEFWPATKSPAQGEASFGLLHLDLNQGPSD